MKRLVLAFAAISLLACGDQKTGSSPKDAPQGDTPVAADNTAPSGDATPDKNWQPQKANYAASDSALVKTADVIKAGKTEKPNILIIWGDDIGWFNVGAYNRGMMGYRTPNIDRIAQDGMLFTDSYGENSCTAGRSAFITGQHPIRTGLTKVGIPGSKLGLQKEDPTIAELLKNHGYMTAQFGKNHLGDLDEYLPSNHGFDEFYGNLYHLNAEEEPEHPHYPKDPRMKKMFGPRGVIDSKSDGTIKDTGPLTKKRMETVDMEVTERSLDFMERATKAKKPFFLWYNATRMHVWTHLKEDSKNKTGQGIYADGMREHDMMVGELLDKVESLGIADNTIIMYSTDNGAEFMTWPDGGSTPFMGEKNTTWEGGFRVPTLVKWPKKIPAGVVSNGIIAHNDWMPTLLAAAGEPDVKEKLLKGHTANGSKFKVHLDGYNQLDMMLGNGPSSRKEFFFVSDDGDLSALRVGDWKALFTEQRAHGFDVWSEPFVNRRLPMVINLRMDPFERAHKESMSYDKWMFEHAFMLYPAQAYVANFVGSLKEFPPRQRPASFSVDQIMERLYQTH